MHCRIEFLKNQVFLLMQIAEEVDTINDLSGMLSLWIKCVMSHDIREGSCIKSFSKDSVGSAMWVCCHGNLLYWLLYWFRLQSGEPHVHVKMNNWSEISTLIHSGEMETVEVKRKRNTVRYEEVYEQYLNV